MSVDQDTRTLTEITGLRDANTQDGTAPRIERVAAVAGVTVVRLSFRAGQSMEDHKARFPILVQGQSGHVTFATADRTVDLVPGVAVHVDAELTHRLQAVEDSVITLLVLR
ncbi:cupin [Rhodococcus gannanensis]|uniref:Cupin n=1 Tax=Rhodococcus gannanensis TaxID=1960308 RepID=A0ABW4P677_9NOCA